MDKIILPRTTEEGKPRVSYSQIKLFNEAKSFNRKIEGKKEYIINYFLGYEQPESGWGRFGKEVEAYIGVREEADKFTDEEKAVLEQIKPLGVLGDKFAIDYGEFVISGIIDDRTEDWSKIRDYKTASKSSKKQYEQEDYKQLDLYALAAIEKTGLIPELEVCAIERKGSLFGGGGREKLTVGGQIWYIPKKTTEARLQELKKHIFKTVLEISDYYKVFLRLNKL